MWHWDFGCNHFYLGNKWRVQVFDQFLRTGREEMSIPAEVCLGPRAGLGRFGEQWNLMFLMGVSFSVTLHLTLCLYPLRHPGFLSTRSHLIFYPRSSAHSQILQSLILFHHHIKKTSRPSRYACSYSTWLCMLYVVYAVRETVNWIH